MSTLPPRSRDRRGSILPVVALLMVALCGFAALAVETAEIAMIKVECQNAADAAALAGARTLDGSASQNYNLALNNARTVAGGNSTLGFSNTGQVAIVPFVASEIAVTLGTLHYDTSSKLFSPAYTLANGENYNLARATVSRAMNNTLFAVDGGAAHPAVRPTIVATSVASHRPRDVAIVLDFSGSMNDESDLWTCDTYYGSYYGSSNNTDPTVPAFGQYSSATAGLVSSASLPGGQCNVTRSMQGMPALVDSYFQTLPSQSPGTAAFTAAPSSYGTQPMGDIPVYVNNAASGSFAQTPNNLFNTSYTTSVPNNSAAESFENGTPSVGSQGSSNNALAGYDKLYLARIPTAPSGRNNLGVNGFSGFTTGPKYYGKTFFQWPPDPRANKDWRQLYFTDASNNPVVNNTSLFTTTGWNPPVNGGTTNYRINYAKILNWIKNVGPNPFPSTLQAGHVVYYNSIPTDVPAAAYDHSQPNSNITDPNQRFWKEYIDYVVGSWRDPYGNVQTPGNQAMSYGPDFTWGTVQVSARPTGTPPNGSKLAYMNYADNPPRPRHRLWFGPMTMLQFISDTGIQSGTVRDLSTYSAKLGIASVLQDVQLNHPNDQVALILYNRPNYSGEPAIGGFSQTLYNLNRDYSGMTNALWYPPVTGTNTCTPWDANGSKTPGADNDFIQNTATQHGLMLAYNQFSGSSTLSGLNAGGLGRVGAKKLVVLETDGMANVNDTAGFTNNGTNSYYNVQPGQTVTSAAYSQAPLLQVVQAICNTSAGVAGTPNSAVTNPGLPGFATPNKPVVVHTIAFGIVFQIASTVQTNSVGLLQAISQIGGTVFPTSSSDPANGYKWVTGDLNTRVQLLQQAFSKIMDDGNSVSLIQ